MTIAHWKQANTDIGLIQPGTLGTNRAAFVVGAKSGVPSLHYWDDVRFALASASKDHVGFFEDWSGITNTSLLPWTKNASGAGTILPKGAAGTANGEIEFSTVNNSDNAWVSLTLGASWKASAGFLWWEARVQPEQISACAFEFGLSDALTETAGVAFSNHSVASVTDVATDAAIFAFDTDNSLTNWTINTVKNGTPQALDTGIAVAASTYYLLKIVVNASGDAEFFIDGASVGTITDAVTSTALLGPWNSTLTRVNNAAKKALVDYIGLIGVRA